MPPEVKNNFEGGLNLDDNSYTLPLNCYVDAQNITRQTVAGSNDKVIANVVGNQKVSYNYPAGTSVVIGNFPFLLRNTIIFFRWNINGYHGVYQYDRTANVITKIFENLTDSANVDVLGFLKDVKIKGVNVLARDEGDILYFLDCLGRPTQMDINLFKAGKYTPVTRDILDKCKKPPLIPPQTVYNNDATTNSNNLTKRLFRFKFRYIYDDYETSVFSPISKVSLPVNILSNTFTNVLTNNNVITLGLTTGDINVKSVDIGVSFVDNTNNWSDFQQVEVIQKSALTLSAHTSTVPQSGTTVNVTSTFTGVVNAGVVINIYLKNISTQAMVLIGTYTTVSNDTVNSIASALSSNITSKGIAIPSSSIINNCFYAYDQSVYYFDSSFVQITGNSSVDNANFSYLFYNNGTYPNYDINESIELYDYVPDEAWAQELINGNVLGYSNITEGINKDTVASSVITVNTIAASNASTNGSLNAVLSGTSDTSFHQIATYGFSGIPAPGTVINVNARLKSTSAISVISTYTTVAGDIVGNVVTGLLNSFVTNYYGSGINVQVEKSTYIPVSGTLYVTISILPPNSTSTSNSIATWKPSTSRIIARQYFDKHGKTNGVLYYDNVTFPAYAENSSQVPLLPYINYKINDIPPSWAYSFGFAFNKIATTWIYWQTVSLIVPTEPYLYFEVTDFVTNATRFPTTSTVCSYAFKQGDRMRIIRDINTNNVPGVNYDAEVLGLLTDPMIDGVVTTPAGRQFIKINNVAPFTSYVNNTHNYVIEIYTPTQQLANANSEVFFEIGEQYLIINPTLPTRVHSGQITNQVAGSTPAEFNFYNGDAYFRSRQIAISNSSVQAFNVFDANFVDSNISAVSSVNGRATIIDVNARQQNFPTLIRYSLAYQPDTNINGLGRFYANNFDQYDLTFGAVTRLKIRSRFLKIFQQFKIGIVPLYGQIMKDANGNVNLIVTSNLLNPIQYRIANIGLSAPESLASYHFADYGCDINLGIIWRDSDDGTIPISRLYKIDSWAKAELPQRKNGIHIYGAFYPNTNDYIIALEATCVAISYVPFTLPNGNIGTQYSYSITLLGTANFTISSLNVPSWMIVAINGSTLTFSGFPNAVVTNGVVSLTVSNGCGSVPINQNITIAAAPCVPVQILSSTLLPTAYATVAYSASLPLSGTAPFTLSAVTAPAWMTVSIVGSNVQFTGTPANGDIGNNVAVDFTVTNACGNIPFAGNINVQAYGVAFTSFTNGSGDSLNYSETDNLISGVAGATVTITVTTYTNSNGGTLKVNSNIVVLNSTFTVTLDSNGNGSFVSLINGVVNPSSIILATYTITATTSGTIGTNNTYQISKAF